jgi:hypothetical protein
MKYNTNNLRRTLLLLGLAVSPGCLADGTVNYGDPSQPPQIEVHFLYSTDDGQTFHELEDGVQIRSVKDRYQIKFVPQQNYVITVYQRGSSGKIAPLVDRMVVEAGIPQTLPKVEKNCGGKRARGYCLDRTTGKETLYFMAYPYDGAKAEAGEFELDKITGCNGSPCVKSVTFEHVD